MRLLVLGGTVFLGRAVARQALAAGHDVTCAARGSSGLPVDGVRFVRVDRDDPDGLRELSGDFDAVIDVARRPSHLRHAVDALAGRVGHFTFVSSGSVYADVATPGQTVADAPVLPAAPPGFDDASADAEAYGRCKVTCEQTAIEVLGADRVFVCRAGLIVGPEDPTGRFEYWVRRIDRGGEVLAPGTPDDAVQLVDVRDLTDWIIHAAATGLVGTFDGIGAPISRAAFYAGLAQGVPSDSRLTYVPPEFLVEQEVNPWAGPRSLPLWLPVPQYGGFLSRDVTASLAAGLRTRPLQETARETLAWLHDGGHSIGLTAEEEAELLRKWHAR